MNFHEYKIKKYVINKHKMLVSKKYKNKIYLIESNLTYIIDLSTLKCSCNSEFCIHLIFFLNNYCKLNLDIIKFFHKAKIKQYFINNIKTDDLNNKLDKIILDEILDDTCGICLNRVKSYETDLLYECHECQKYCHRICLNKFLMIDKNSNKTCMYCRHILIF